MFKEDSPSPSRKASGGSLSLIVGDADWRDVPLLFARRDARWLTRAAVRAALPRFVGRGLALSTRARGAGASGTGTGTGSSGGGVSCGGGGGGGAGDEVDGAVVVATIAATPVVGVAGGEHLSPASILSTLRLALLARSRLLLPEGYAWARAAWARAAWDVSLAAVLNQSQTSSLVPSVSSTSLAGTPSSLQRTHALYWEKAHGGGRGV